MIDLEYTLVQMYLKDVRAATLEEKIRQALRKKEMCQHVLQVFNMVRHIYLSVILTMYIKQNFFFTMF
jgi:hypothetical protein